MLGTYKDMTFCSFHADCAAAPNCHRPLTDRVIEAAARLGIPIGQFIEKPDCHVMIEQTKEQE